MSRPAPDISITHCLCRRIAFAELLPSARAGQWTLDMLVAETGCGGSCGLCRPYLQCMIETGQTTFHELLEQQP